MIIIRREMSLTNTKAYDYDDNTIMNIDNTTINVMEVFSKDGKLSKRTTTCRNIDNPVEILIEIQEHFQDNRLYSMDKYIYDKGNIAEEIKLFYFTDEIDIDDIYTEDPYIGIRSKIAINKLTGLTTITDYYKSGMVRSKVVWLNNRKQSEVVCNEDGTIKIDKILS